MRKEKIEHLVVTGKIEGKKSRGRPRLTYISSLGKCSGLSEVELLFNTKNRAVWRAIIKYNLLCFELFSHLFTHLHVTNNHSCVNPFNTFSIRA